jgi:hypothetical protein
MMESEYQKASTYNSISVKNTRPYRVKESLKNWMSLAEELVELKTKLHVANVNGGMLSKIFLLSELKNQALRLYRLDCSEGVVSGRYDSAETVKHVELTVVERDEMIASIQEKIEKIEGELDEFNHKTIIDGV